MKKENIIITIGALMMWVIIAVGVAQAIKGMSGR